MSIINVYVKKEGKTTWIEMDTFPLIEMLHHITY